jgi:hypothetical protein
VTAFGWAPFITGFVPFHSCDLVSKSFLCYRISFLLFYLRVEYCFPSSESLVYDAIAATFEINICECEREAKRKGAFHIVWVSHRLGAARGEGSFPYVCFFIRLRLSFPKPPD